MLQKIHFKYVDKELQRAKQRIPKDAYLVKSLLVETLYTKVYSEIITVNPVFNLWWSRC